MPYLKKIAFFILAIFAVAPFTQSCNSSGNAKEDAETFCQRLLQSYNANNITEMSEIIDEYYDKYENASPNEQKAFFENFKEALEKSDVNLDSEKWVNMIREADPSDKLDRLFHQSMQE